MGSVSEKLSGILLTPFFFQCPCSWPKLIYNRFPFFFPLNLCLISTVQAPIFAHPLSSPFRSSSLAPDISLTSKLPLLRSSCCGLGDMDYCCTPLCSSRSPFVPMILVPALFYFPGHSLLLCRFHSISSTHPPLQIVHAPVCLSSPLLFCF